MKIERKFQRNGVIKDDQNNDTEVRLFLFISGKLM